MAPKRLLEDPPPAASSSEEESGSDAADEEVNGGSEGVEDDEEKSVDEEEDDEEEEEDAAQQKNKPTTNKCTVATPSKASERQSSSGSDDESGTESDSESNKTQPSPSVSDFTIKPISSKPMNDSVKPKKSAPKPAPAPATKVTSASKRASESHIEGKDSKKKKLSNGHDEDVKKGSGIQRLWSEDDEIAILKGMIEFQSKKGVDPHADMGVFHEFIKKNLNADVSKNQLQDKIRRLKKKYQVNAEKGENGEDPVFSKPHEHKAFELSKKIWGPGAAAASGKRKANQSKVKNSSTLPSPKREVVEKKKEEPSSEINAESEKPCSNYLSELLVSEKLLTPPESVTSLMKESLPLIETAKAKELERKWEKLKEEECQLYLKKIDLIRESAKLVLESKKSS
ncbi:hypothetical protein L6164_022253 [Bauhinia variegata]|uniref:Uncharacterized protein n=1 Tax=Bauhinia variegata TaxID=167791 RepID=A0ACB9MFL9_BAUVA|nr:hypothetical protein L6164_022253 [Bauhinia variegata]